MNQRIGYARVSVSDQNPDLQRDALHQAGCDDIYEETASGKSTDRPQLTECLRRLRRGDTLVVWKLDRLGRSLADLVRIADDLRTRGVFIELRQPHVVFDDSTLGKAMYAMFGMFAEMERDLIRERTHAGLAAARARGRAGGRKPKLDEKQVREIKALMRDPTIPVSTIAKRYKVSRTTIYKVAPVRQAAPTRRT
ncbi:recombinase family protein [Pandoraea nosoerga]|uniref:recombinase family protein n=1 Tax=Burkholderiales TaxID=80840 RepID=UPI00198248BE|nr:MULTISPECIES: recombinase family protein [Burkholderiales]MBN4664308.1 recombinase family protein [Pandoraea nosoerga]MBN4675796.1 recombinase family protein [Pandoraea nosoerga]MBN4679397.1 recombinase family protein [Pandoraea nosoerga]MBN4743606.1 recombinase family protein [Pandoraea nosoerga]MCH4592554.1 recombinase family protein [Achromobacter xylosoxidans]